MKILILGATGFIGKNLSNKLLEEGNTIYALTRNSKKIFDRRINFALWDGEKIPENLDGFDAIINLAGENIFSILYNKNKKRKIIESRVNAGKAILNFIEKTKIRPEVLIQASAIGYYGNSDEEKDEFSPPGKDFLSEVCIEWEKSTEKIEKYGIRRCIIRIGIVLGKGGFLSKILLFQKFPFLFIIGNPENFISFIHIEDLINAIIFLIKNKNCKGIYNLVSPFPIKFYDLYNTLAKILNKKLIKFPDFFFKILMQKMADEVIFFNQKIIPKRILEEKFEFSYSDIEKALTEILK
ncbi:MAG: TIGR01777 family oxidoreductase [candidate division WOR-3 bacterium]